MNGRMGLASWRWVFIFDFILGIPIALFGFLCCPREHSLQNDLPALLIQSRRAQSFETVVDDRGRARDIDCPYVFRKPWCRESRMEPESSKENSPFMAVNCLLRCLGVSQPLGSSVALYWLLTNNSDWWNWPVVPTFNGGWHCTWSPWKSTATTNTA